jgi:hypothetical protein
MADSTYTLKCKCIHFLQLSKPSSTGLGQARISDQETSETPGTTHPGRHYESLLLTIGGDAIERFQIGLVDALRKVEDASEVRLDAGGRY